MKTELDDIIYYNSPHLQSFDTYIAPTMSLADIVIPQGVDNEVAMQLIIQHVKRELDRLLRIQYPSDIPC